MSVKGARVVKVLGVVKEGDGRDGMGRDGMIFFFFFGYFGFRLP